MNDEELEKINPPTLPYGLDEKIFHDTDEDGNTIEPPYSYNDFLERIKNISGVNSDLFEGIDPPAEMPIRRQIDVHGREEHEAMLRDEKKMLELGLDPVYERIVYLKRWGGWLNES